MSKDQVLRSRNARQRPGTSGSSRACLSSRLSPRSYTPTMSRRFCRESSAGGSVPWFPRSHFSAYALFQFRRHPALAVSPPRRAAGRGDGHDVRNQRGAGNPARRCLRLRGAHSSRRSWYASSLISCSPRVPASISLPSFFRPSRRWAAYIFAAGAFLTPTEQIWLIGNPSAMAVVLSLVALHQERANVRELRTRTELGRAEECAAGKREEIPRPFRQRGSGDVPQQPGRVGAHRGQSQLPGPSGPDARSSWAPARRRCTGLLRANARRCSAFLRATAG